jgi:F420-dependent oxidoreductase-like protein
MKLALHAMKTTANFGCWGNDLQANLDVIREAEALGYESVWTAEASGTDAVVPLAWLSGQTSTIKLGTAVMQMAARSPANTAQTAATLDLFSQGRFLLGLGASGPAVVEAWHSQPYGKPVARTAEYVDIVRTILARVGPITHHGEYYDIPYERADSTGLANPIKLMFRPKRRKIPIYLAAMGPKNLTLAYRIADGILPAFYSPFREREFFDGVERGTRAIDVAPFVTVVMGDDLDICRDKARAGLAFWIGGMGARGLNFYNKLFARLGFPEDARRVQDLYMKERRIEAAAAISDQFIDEIALIGSKARIADQLEAWKESSVTTLILMSADRNALQTVAEIVL